MNDKYYDRNDGSIPRVLNWAYNYYIKFEKIYTTLSLNEKEV